jgi:antitoxin YefM
MLAMIIITGRGKSIGLARSIVIRDTQKMEVSMANQTVRIQYISDDKGKTVGVIVPIALWQEIESERETAYLLRSNAMKQRLVEAKERRGGLSIEDVCEKLGI